MTRLRLPLTWRTSRQAASRWTSLDTRRNQDQPRSAATPRPEQTTRQHFIVLQSKSNVSRNA